MDDDGFSGLRLQQSFSLDSGFHTLPSGGLEGSEGLEGLDR